MNFKAPKPQKKAVSDRIAPKAPLATAATSSPVNPAPGLRQATRDALDTRLVNGQDVALPTTEAVGKVREAMLGLHQVSLTLASAFPALAGAEGYLSGEATMLRYSVAHRASMRSSALEIAFTEEERSASRGYLELKVLEANAGAMAAEPYGALAKRFLDLSGGQPAARVVGAHLEAFLAYDALANHPEVQDEDARTREREGKLPWNRQQANAHLAAAQAGLVELAQALGASEEGRTRFEATRAALLEQVPEWLGAHFGAPIEEGFLRMAVTSEGDLRITPLESMAKFKKMVKGLLGESKHANEYSVFDDLIQPFIENGYLERVRADEIGALTDDTNLFTMTREENDRGELLGVGVVYHQDDYQINSALENLLEDGELVLQSTGAKGEAEPSHEWMRP